jgi:uncharacterized protein DUF3485
MKRLLPPLLASAALVAAGLVHGYWTDRWVPPADTAAAAARLAEIPRHLGKPLGGGTWEWEGEDIEVKPGTTPDGIAGNLQRRYKNTSTGAVVVVVLVCGRAGPVAIHPPESCYTASGFEFGTRERVTAGPSAQFFTADAVRTRAAEETRVRLFWAWNPGTGWQAPHDARTAFPRVPVLHKLYVLRELGAVDEPAKDDPCYAFLQVLLPAMDKTLFAGP